MSDRPATWQDEQAAVEAAFERSGVARTWLDDEPDQMVPMVNAMAAEIASLRLAIARLAEQDATLSVCDGKVTVTMDVTPEMLEQLSQRGGPLVPFDPPHPTLTSDERYAIEAAARIADHYDAEMDGFPSGVGDTLRKMAIRIGGEW